jgi:hypothetical protein
MLAANPSFTHMLDSVPMRTPCAATGGVICPAEASETAVVVVVPLETIPLIKLVMRKPVIPNKC